MTSKRLGANISLDAPGAFFPMPQSDTNPSTPAAARAYSIEGFCRAYGVGATTAKVAIRHRTLRAVKCGRKTLISAEAAEEWFRSLPAARGA